MHLPTKKLACLLTLLACTSPQRQAREKLATLLWGSSDETRARHNLRQAVSRIRQLLGSDVLVIDGETIALAQGVIDCDAVLLEGLIREDSPDSLVAAADLYVGPLLDGIVVREDAWTDWLSMERERLSERAIGAMVKHGGHKLALGEAEAALGLGQRAIQLNPFREDAHRLKLQALSASGRKSEAFRHYQTLVGFLKTELLSEPDEATRSLIAELRRDRPAPESPSASEAAGLPGAFPAPSVPPLLDQASGPAAPPRSSAVTPIESPSRDAPERRQVTVLIAGPAGAASPGGRTDPDAAHERILAFRRTVSEVAERFGGSLAPSPGAAAHVYFGHPFSSEHDALNAARCGVALVDAVADATAGLSARVSLATGLVVVGSDQVVIGEAPASAERLQALAAPGEIVACRETKLLLARRFHVQPIDGTGRGGAAEKPQAWLVRGERYGQKNRDLGAGAKSPFTGRHEEMDLLLRRWRQAQRGEGRLVLISGEPGIGKSHLAEGLMRHVQNDRAARLRYFCSELATIHPLHPFIAQIEWSARLSTSQAPEEKLDKLEALIAPASSEPDRDMALIAEILGIPSGGRYPELKEDPKQKRELAIRLYLQALERLAAERPAVVLFEDIHWIDPTSLDVLDRIIALIVRLPVLVIATCRPEHRPSWIGQPHMTMIHLNRLDRPDAAVLIGEFTHDRPLPGPVIEEIIENADGVPLFLKELSRHAIESAVDDEMSDGGVSRPSRRPLIVPTTLQGSLIARLDRLGNGKEVALIGSAIGRSFPYELLAEVFDGSTTDLGAALVPLEASGLVTRRGLTPAAIYTFTHALVRDAAYAMMLRDQRRRLHAKIATALLAQSIVAAPPEIIAHHLSEAGRRHDAIDHWIEAGRLALSRWANRECVEFFGMAMTALAELPQTPDILRRQIDLRFEFKNVLIPMGEFGRIDDLLQEARGFAESLGDRSRLCQFHVNICQSLTLGGAPKDAIEHGLKAREIAQSLNEATLMVEATVLLAMSYIIVMDYENAEHLFLSVLPLLDTELRGKRLALTGYPEISARSFLTRINAARGKYEEGIRFGLEAISRGEELEQPYSLSVACWCLADLYLSRGDVGSAEGLLERGMAISQRGDLPVMVAAYNGSRGYAFALMGRLEEGLPLLKQSMSVFDRMQHQLGLSLFLVPLAEAHMAASRHEEASDLAMRALAIARESGQRSGEAAAFHVLAEIAALSDRLEQAEELYRDGLALAERHDLRPIIARCRHGLGLLNLRTGDLAEARGNLRLAKTLYREMGMLYGLEKLNASFPE